MKKYKKLIIALIILIILLTISLLLNKNNNNKKYENITDFANSKEVIEYFKDDYITQKESTKEEYDIEIYVKFNTELKKENRYHFESLIQIITEVNKYKNILIIDEKNNIQISILCNQDNQLITQVLINNVENYFDKLESNDTIKNILNIENINLNLSNTQLENIVQNDWKIRNINLGTKESEYEGYDIYFEEGIKAKIVNGKIFNIVFTKKYTQDVLEGVNTTMDYEQIVNKLGNPTIYSNETKVYGYKSDDIYIFFSDDEISVYPNINNENKNEVLEVISNYSPDKEQNLIIYEITEALTDYDKKIYSYDAYLLYTLRGLEINITRQGELQILVYSNYKGNILEDLTINEINNQNKSKISKYVFLHLDKDLVFETERKRLISKQQIYKEAYDIYNISPDNKIGISYITDKNQNKIGIKIISLDDEHFNYKMSINNLQSVIWLDNENIIFSQKKIGIYKYNIYTKELTNLIEEKSDFSDLKIENGKLQYDGNKEVII